MQPPPVPGLLRHVSLPAGACNGANRSVKRKADWLDPQPGTPGAVPDAQHGGTPQECHSRGRSAAEGRTEDLIGAHYGSALRRPQPPQPPHVWPGTSIPAASIAMGSPCIDWQGHSAAAKQTCTSETRRALLRTASAPSRVIPFLSPPVPLAAHQYAALTEATLQQAPPQLWHSAQPWQQQQHSQPWSQGQQFHSVWHSTPPPTPQHPLPSPFPAWTHQPCWPQSYGTAAGQPAGWAPQRNLQRAFGVEITNRRVHAKVANRCQLRSCQAHVSFLRKPSLSCDVRDGGRCARGGQAVYANAQAPRSGLQSARTEGHAASAEGPSGCKRAASSHCGEPPHHRCTCVACETAARRLRAWWPANCSRSARPEFDAQLVRR